MKTIKIFGLLLAYFAINQLQAQFVHANTFSPESKHTVQLNLGWDYGLVYELGYSYRLNTKVPVRLQAFYSFPSGNTAFDDFKTKVGAQARVLRSGNLQAHLGLYGIYRQFENPLVGLRNFGGEARAMIGYFRPRWFVGGEVGFDKAIATQFKHEDAFRDNIYGDVKDGWYQAGTGGNLYYGIQAGYSFKKNSVLLSMGEVRTEAINTTPQLPAYFKLGYQRSL
ncbi:MAG: hypothetical protein HRU41_36175 [Saprospiraceae bacterium]|nr:hypothetical protein [Saprospiraceae bacterium]